MRVDKQNKPLIKHSWNHSGRKVRDDFTYQYQKALETFMRLALSDGGTAHGSLLVQTSFVPLGKSADEICRICGSEAETAEHMKYKRQELAGLRTTTYGKTSSGHPRDNGQGC